MRKKKDPLNYVLYGIIALAVVYLAAALGAALDMSVSESGELDFGVFPTTFESVLTDTDVIFEHFSTSGSYAQTLPFAALFALGIYALMKYTSKKRLHRKGVEHGSARWANEKEEKFLADMPEKKKGGKSAKADKPKSPFETDNNVLLTQEVRMSLNTRQHRENLNVLVIGGSGSGKSRFYVKPNLMQLNTSYVVTDPKGELLRSCGRLLKKAGYAIRVFNLIDMAHSNNYNPFNYVYDRDGKVNKSYVLKMINCLMKNTKKEGASGGDQFWDDATQALLSAISFYLIEKAEPQDRNFGTVMKVMKLAEISEQDENMQSPLDEMMNELAEENPYSMAVTYYKDFKKAPAETAKSILISAAVRLQAFNLPEVGDLTHIDNIHLDTLGDKKTALFVIIPSSDATFNFLAAMMYTQLFDTLYDTANFKYGGRLPVHVRCLLDEFANIGTIPDFDKLLATMRSMEISANIIIQNLAQLKKMYDKSWEIVTGNCDSLLFLGGQEASTLEAISKSLGKETIDVVSQNRTKSHKSPSTSENNSIMGRELMTPDELKVMKPNECVLIVRALYPFFCHKFDIEKHPNYKYLEDSNRNYAYLIDELRTVQQPDNAELYTEKIPPKEKEPMYADIDIPEDDDTLTPETAGGDSSDKYSLEDEFTNPFEGDSETQQQEQGSASERLFAVDDMEDEELPDDITAADFSSDAIISDDDVLDLMSIF